MAERVPAKLRGYAIDAIPVRGGIRVLLDGFREVFLKTTFPIYVATDNPPDFFEHPDVASAEEEKWESFEGPVRLYHVEVEDIGALSAFRRKFKLYNTTPSPLAQALVRLNVLPFRLVEFGEAPRVLSGLNDFPEISYAEVRRYSWFGPDRRGNRYRVFLNGKLIDEGEGSPKLSCDVAYCEGECDGVRAVLKLHPRSRDFSLKADMERSLVARAPLREIAGSSIGKALTINEAWVAIRRRFAVPDVKVNVERPRALKDLINDDRAGLIVFPRPGFHDAAYQLDFTSMYPSIIVTRNISPENAQAGSPGGQLGIVPEALKGLLEARQALKGIDGERADAVKLMLVASFGYLGYRNSKFGRVEAYEQVTRAAREALREAIGLAEKRGFEVLHGIVDSLTVKGPREALEGLMLSIEEATGLGMRVDAEYDWVAFTRGLLGEPHPQRYFGRVRGGALKVRGVIKADQPNLIKGFLLDLLFVASREIRGEDARKAMLDALPSLAEKYVKLSADGEPLDYVMMVRGVPYVRGAGGFYRAYAYRGHDPIYYADYVRRTAKEVRGWLEDGVRRA
ncbi:DNA polymerase domain-containing protein [Tardisphaera miroshnichenkoae]